MRSDSEACAMEDSSYSSKSTFEAINKKDIGR